jgi:hypothetical protein
MKKEMKGLFIILLILTSIICSNFALSANITKTSSQNLNNEYPADPNDLKFVESITGAFYSDVLDSNPIKNDIITYDFSYANNETFLKTINNELQKNETLRSSNLEFLGFNFKPINNNYFNVAVDNKNKKITVTKLQDVPLNTQVAFLSMELIFKDKNSNTIIYIPLSNSLADENPQNPSSLKRVDNLDNIPKDNNPVGLSHNVCMMLCGGVGAVVTVGTEASCLGSCVVIGPGCLLCVFLAGSVSVGTTVICYDWCRQCPGPF